MRTRKTAKLRLGRSAIVGLRLGACLAGIAAAITLAAFGFNAYKARTGSPGGEALILPAYAATFYVGWSWRGDADADRREKRGAK